MLGTNFEEVPPTTCVLTSHELTRGNDMDLLVDDTWQTISGHDLAAHMLTYGDHWDMTWQTKVC